MGWCHMALQYSFLHTIGYNEVRHPLHLKRKSLAQPTRKQGIYILGLRLLIESLFYLLTQPPSQTAFTTKKDYGKEEREAQWALAQRTLHGLQPPETSNLFNDKNNYRELSEIAEQAKRRAEVAR